MVMTSCHLGLYVTPFIFFSPLGKLAGRAIYFACVNFFFFILYFFYYEQSYLSIYWNDFHHLFTNWKVFAWIFLIRSSFCDSSRDVAMATNFVSYWTCPLGAEVSQYPLGQFSQCLHHMVGIELQMAHLYTFFTTWQKTGIFSQISQEILDRFIHSFHHMKALWVQMIDLYVAFRFVEESCHGNQLILVKCHERRLIPVAFFARLPDGSTILFC